MKYFKILFVLYFILLTNSAIADNWLDGSIVSIQVVDLETGENVYELNPDLSMTPASSLKLVTAYSALKLLPHDYKFLTKVYYDGKITSNNLLGNLYIKFSGDPTLTRDDIFDLLKKLKILNIKGNVYIDTTAFDDEHYGPAWAIDNMNFCYQSPITAGVVDKLCSSFELNNDFYKPLLSKPNIKLRNFINYNNEEDCELELQHQYNDIFKLHGCSTIENLPKKLNIAVIDNKKYLLTLIKTMLNKNNIKYYSVQFSKTIPTANFIRAHESQELSEILKLLLKNSDNQIAESLFKTFSYIRYDQGTWKNSQKIVKNLLAQEFNENLNNIRIVDGSGLSRQNLLNVRFFNKLLQKIYNDNLIFPHILQALPIASHDGTLKKRFLYSNFKTNIFAKTGILTNVSSLTGYILCLNNKDYSFSIIINNSLINNQQLIEKTDDIVETLATNISQYY